MQTRQNKVHNEVNKLQTNKKCTTKCCVIGSFWHHKLWVLRSNLQGKKEQVAETSLTDHNN